MINYQINYKYKINTKILFIYLLLWQMSITSFLSGTEFFMDPNPVGVAINPCPNYSLINSVDFHPKQNLFCVTYTHGNQIVLYKTNANGYPKIFQTISNPSANLSEPQHAVFSSDGKKIVVANWTNQTLTIYKSASSGYFREEPVAIIPSPSHLMNHKPHGIAISPSGHFLAIAYGAAKHYGRAIAVFKVDKEGVDYELISLLKDHEIPGIPKGITFSPDGNCLLVTFSDENSLIIYNFDKNSQKLSSIPHQIIQGLETQISRPEDVKISSDGKYCAVTNSDQHTVTFYPFDKNLNLISQDTPTYILCNPKANLCFPHGIAFSPNGSFIAVTEFGPINISKGGNIIWDHTMQPDQSKVSIYKMVNK